jgi:AcrR family transcriptional regulator
VAETMRKKPRQARALKTVDFILDAATYILAERGLDGFTTNRIADRAGVNIASLYQYFPDKLAILKALQARHIAAPDIGYGAWLDRLRNLPLEPVVRSIVAAAFEMHAEHPTIQKLFLDTLPRQTRHPHEHFEAERISKMAAILLPKSRASRNPDMMIFVTRHALMSIVHETVCERPEWLTDPVFREELVRLLVNFLRVE